MHAVPRWFVGEFVGTFLLVFFGCGSVCAAVLFIIFRDALAAFESANQIVRGQPGSEASAMIFGEYFPNPGGRPLTDEARLKMSPSAAFGAEIIGTSVLMLVIGWAGDERNQARPTGLVPVLIGLTVTLLISLLGPLTMACFNPARDLGPRVFSALAGWGGVPFAVNGSGWLTVYVLAPILGALLVGGLHRTLLKTPAQPG